MLNATNAIVTTTMEGVSYVKEYIYLRENNETLAKENAKLRSQLAEGQYDSTTSRIQVKDSGFFQQYSYMTAKIINNTINHRNNYLTLNKGSIQGVKPEMGVITSNGVIGIVKQVSTHYCTVMSILHKDMKISAMISRNKFFGSLTWDGINPHYATLNEIDKTVPVQRGDSIVTTSYSKIFPAGIFVGRVSEVRKQPGSNFQEIIIRLSTQFDNLSNVYIVNNLLKEEQRVIEEGNTQEPK